MIQVINRAFNIMEVIAQNTDKEWGLSEIADTLGLNHGTCANILKTLMQRGYVEQAKQKKGYKLGYMAYKLTNSSEYNAKLLRIAQKPIDDLCHVINETVILSVIKNNKRVLVYEAVCDHDIQIRTSFEQDVYRATTGRMILAHYSPKELNDFVNATGLPTPDAWPGIQSEEDLMHALDNIRKKDIEITCNSNHVVGLATPLFLNNKILAGLGIYLPDIRFSKDEQKHIVSQMMHTTKIINEMLKQGV